MSVQFHLPLGPQADELVGAAAGGSSPEAGEGSALRAFEAAARREPCDPDYAFVLARALLLSGRAAEAAARVRAALDLGHGRPEYHFVLGCALWKLGRADEAAAAFAEAARLQPADAGVLTAQAAALVQAGRRTEAAAAYAAALALDPARAEAHGGLGVLRWQEGCKEQALELLATAVALRPEAPALLRNYGLALQASGKGAAALAVLRRAAAAAPGNADARLDLAEATWAAGRREEAVAALEAARRLDPAAIARRPESAAIGDALQLESLRAETAARANGLGHLAGRAASAVFHCAALATGLSRGLWSRQWLLIAAPLLAVAVLVRYLPPYVRHFLVCDDVAEVARTPLEDDGVIRVRLAHAFDARGMRRLLDPDSCSVTTRSPLRRIACGYEVPVSVLPGLRHTLVFRIDVEQPFLPRDAGGR